MYTYIIYIHIYIYNIIYIYIYIYLYIYVEISDANKQQCAVYLQQFDYNNLLFSEIKIDFASYADDTTLYTCNLKMEKVIKTLEKKC